MNQITNYEDLINLILTQYKDSEKLKGIIEAGLSNANDIEVALFEIQDNMYLSSAAGAQLDFIGSVFNESRLGRDDTEYRLAIQQKAGQYASGEPENIMDYIKAAFGATFAEYSPQYPGKYNIRTDVPLLSSDIQPISPAGVFPFVLKLFETGDSTKFIAGAGDKYMCAVIEFEEVNITDYDGNILVDGNENFIQTSVFVD